MRPAGTKSALAVPRQSASFLKRTKGVLNGAAGHAYAVSEVLREFDNGIGEILAAISGSQPPNFGGNDFSVWTVHSGDCSWYANGLPLGLVLCTVPALPKHATI
jgi:hypothetical protein